MKPEEVIQLARGAGLLKYKPEIHGNHRAQLPGSRDCAGGILRSFGPIIHDALLAFLDGLNEERMIERAMALANAKGHPGVTRF